MSKTLGRGQVITKLQVFEHQGSDWQRLALGLTLQIGFVRPPAQGAGWLHYKQELCSPSLIWSGMAMQYFIPRC